MNKTGYDSNGSGENAGEAPCGNSDLYPAGIDHQSSGNVVRGVAVSLEREFPVRMKYRSVATNGIRKGCITNGGLVQVDKLAVPANNPVFEWM